MRRKILIIRNSLSPTSFEGSEEAGAAFFYACGMSWQPGSSLKKERKKNSEKVVSSLQGAEEAATSAG